MSISRETCCNETLFEWMNPDAPRILNDNEFFYFQPSRLNRSVSANKESQME